MSNPYAPPQSEIARPEPPSNWFLYSLTFGVPAFLCALHALGCVGMILLAWTDVASGRDPSMREVLLRPLIYVQPLSTLATGLFLLLRRRKALIGACALPIIIVVYAIHYDTRMDLLHLVCAVFLAVYVTLLTVLRKLG